MNRGRILGESRMRLRLDWINKIMHVEKGAGPGHAGAVVEANCLLGKSVSEGQCHLTILRRFSWPRIAIYICAERWNKMHSCIHVGQNCFFQWLFSNKISESHVMSSGHRGFRRYIVVYRSLYILYSLYIIYSFKRSDFRSSGILEDRVTIHGTWVIIRDLCCKIRYFPIFIEKYDH